MKYLRWFIGALFIGLAGVQLADYQGFSNLLLATQLVDTQFLQGAVMMCMIIELLMGSTFLIPHDDI
jgi:hypothetical protein